MFDLVTFTLFAATHHQTAHCADMCRQTKHTGGNISLSKRRALHSLVVFIRICGNGMYRCNRKIYPEIGGIALQRTCKDGACVVPMLSIAASTVAFVDMCACLPQLDSTCSPRLIAPFNCDKFRDGYYLHNMK